MGKHSRGPEGPKGPDEREYDVGYGKPPKEHQFQPGRSGNPTGRPKKQPSMQSIIRDVAYHPVRIGGPEGSETVPLVKAALMGSLQQGAKGRGGFTKAFVEMMRQNDVGMDASDEDVASIDAELFDRVMRELK
jgi:hypothetical protein